MLKSTLDYTIFFTFLQSANKKKKPNECTVRLVSADLDDGKHVHTPNIDLIGLTAKSLSDGLPDQVEVVLRDHRFIDPTIEESGVRVILLRYDTVLAGLEFRIGLSVGEEHQIALASSNREGRHVRTMSLHMFISIFTTVRIIEVHIHTARRQSFPKGIHVLEAHADTPTKRFIKRGVRKTKDLYIF